MLNVLFHSNIVPVSDAGRDQIHQSLEGARLITWFYVPQPKNFSEQKICRASEIIPLPLDSIFEHTTLIINRNNKSCGFANLYQVGSDSCAGLSNLCRS
jgi:hypothetical protein